jgi:hypothetical protein
MSRGRSSRMSVEDVPGSAEQRYYYLVLQGHLVEPGSTRMLNIYYAGCPSGDHPIYSGDCELLIAPYYIDKPLGLGSSM